MKLSAIVLWFGFSRLVTLVHAYDLVRDYSGKDFFSAWDFYGSWDNLTLGNVNYLDQANATSQNLAYVNGAGNAIIKVDNATNVPLGGNRNSIRITSQDAYDIGSLWIFDVAHIPYGCTTWPAIWSFAPGNWPGGGEIDVVEAINMMTNNQMALHTTQGCTKTTPPNQSGVSGQGDCSQGSGCLVSETKPNSWGSGFAQAGGGVFAAQLDVAGIFMWFWSRPNVPASINESTSTSSMNISDWGNPSGSWPSSSCNISTYFAPQKLVVDITLCGDWAGVPSIYNSSCPNTGVCANNVAGNGSNFDNAYFEIPFIRAYSVTPPTSSASSLSNSQSASPTATTVTIRTPVPSPGSNRTSVGVRRHGIGASLIGKIILFVFAWCLWGL